MALQPLNNAEKCDRPDRPLTARGWGMALALAAIILNGLALAAGTSGGGLGWVQALPCLCMNGVAALICACISTYFSLLCLSRHRGYDSLAWIALVIAVVAASWTLLMAEWTVAAVQAV